MATKIAGRTNLATLADGDELPVSDGDTKKVSVLTLAGQLFSRIASLVSLTGDPALDDEMLLTDTSDTGTAKRTTIQKLLEYFAGLGAIGSDVALWEDLRFPASDVSPGIANPPDWVLAKTGTVDYGQLYVLEFDHNTEEEVYTFAQLPHSWKEGTEIRPHLHWVNHDDGVGDVVWELEFTMANVGAVFSETPTIIQAVDTAVANVAGEFEHQVAVFPAITMTGMNLSSMLMIRLYRKAADVADTCTTPVGFLEFDIHVQQNTVGSIGEFDKDGV